MKKIKNIKQLLLQILLVICILAVVIFAGMIVRELLIDKQSQTFYENILAGIETNPREQSSPTGQDNRPGSNPDDISDEPFVPYVDFDKLNERFPGIVGWIKLYDSPIDYPVMQHTNNDYFLSRLPDGTSHRSGSIFLDYRNSSDFSDRSILIYGHESHEREMFGILKNYRNQSFFDENPVMYLYTPERDYEIRIFAVHLAHSQRDHPPLSFRDEEEFMQYIRQIQSISLITSGIEISAGDRIVSLCTCAYDFDEARLVIVGVLI